MYSNNPKLDQYKSTQRLKTLHSLLYDNHQTHDIEPIRTSPIQSTSSSINFQDGFIIKSKSTEKLHQPRQINSWDDI